ncbi:uncharacterized protein PAC_12441 [Phialocephala subalpina]|uniref:GEgh 16 protein n=1 Tax=Phialocephala subalpina TaxID=576137 RepID=A0A1L7XBY7_9HELO|nr:uncharacterized protein PAC_12441 [Phialocephala subalpina]
MPSYRISALLTFATLVLSGTSAVVPERNIVDIGAINGGVTARTVANIGTIDNVTARKVVDVDAGVTARNGLKIPGVDNVTARKVAGIGAIDNVTAREELKIAGVDNMTARKVAGIGAIDNVTARKELKIGAGVTARDEDNSNLSDYCYWVSPDEYICTTEPRLHIPRNSVKIGTIDNVTARKVADIGAVDNVTARDELEIPGVDNVTARKVADIGAVDGVTARGGGPTCRRSIGNKGARGGCYDGSSKRGDDGGCC